MTCTLISFFALKLVMERAEAILSEWWLQERTLRLFQRQGHDCFAGVFVSALIEEVGFVHPNIQTPGPPRGACPG